MLLHLFKRGRIINFVCFGSLHMHMRKIHWDFQSKSSLLEQPYKDLRGYVFEMNDKFQIVAGNSFEAIHHIEMKI